MCVLGFINYIYNQINFESHFRIDHWDKEKERYVLLCERCLIILEYDFERLEIKTLHLYDYSRFDTIRVGPLCYPEMSFNS